MKLELVTVFWRKKFEWMVSEKLDNCIILPVVHSTSGEPVVPGRHLQTNTVRSLMHSAFLPHPIVRQSGAIFSGVPINTKNGIER